MGEKPSFVIITGLSGAGKSYAIKCFEDMGYFCVDNLPTTLIPTFAALCAQSTREIRRIALGVDVREREYLAHLVETLQELKQRGYPTEVLFLEAGDESLVRRYHETRRRHPLPAGRQVPARTRGGRECPGRDPGRAEGDGQRPGDRRPDRGHLGPDRPPAQGAAGGFLRGDEEPGRTDGVAGLLRLQARDPVRLGPGLRRPLPPQPPLRGRAAPPRRARPGGEGLRAQARGKPRAAGPAEGPARFPAAVLPARGESLPDRRRRMHRRAAPVGGPRRRAPPVPRGPRVSARRHPPGPGP